MTDLGHTGMGLWNEEDGFFYDVLRLPGGNVEQMRVRSLVGLIPMLAVEVIDPKLILALPEFAGRLRWFLRYRPDLAGLISRWSEPGVGESSLLSLLRGHRLKMLLARMLDESEMLSAARGAVAFQGARGAALHLQPRRARLRRVLRARQLQHQAVRRQLQLARPGLDAAQRAADRGAAALPPLLRRRFHRGVPGRIRPDAAPWPTRRPRSRTGWCGCFCATALASGRRCATSPCRAGAGEGEDALLFNEYFHGDDGRGLGASHQTGWTGLVALLIQDGCGWRKRR